MLGQNIGRVGLPDMSAGGRPSLTLDFVGIPVLNERITFSRTSGATWFSPDGVLEGVDFSTSSVAIGTGSKTFTLTADAGANRYWAVGDLVLVSQQSNSANFMEGTVTSYTASTQVLVIDVTSTGGSGTIASWRVASHMPRFDYNPSTLAARGLLIEEQRTNSIRNNTMQGAVAGTPGTSPTNWQQAGLGTLTREIVGTGTENGITYIDIKYSGTTSTTSLALLPEQLTQITAASGQTWASTFFLKLQAGSTANITSLANQIRGYDSGGIIQESNSTAVSLTPSLTRFAYSYTLANAASTRVVNALLFSFSSGVAIDITLRIGLPQLEQGAFATSVIPTTTTALTRSADVASVNTLSPWWNASEGTFYVEGSAGSLANSPIFVMPHDGTSNNYLNSPVLTTTGLGRLAGVVGGAAWTNVNTANSTTANTTFKSASAFKAGDQAICLNAGTVATGVNASVPVVTTVKLGDWRTSGNSINGYLRRITYYPRRLSNAELQAITA